MLFPITSFELILPIVPDTLKSVCLNNLFKNRIWKGGLIKIGSKVVTSWPWGEYKRKEKVLITSSLKMKSAHILLLIFFVTVINAQFGPGPYPPSGFGPGPYPPSGFGPGPYPPPYPPPRPFFPQPTLGQLIANIATSGGMGWGNNNNGGGRGLFGRIYKNS